jgi:hypothetical protein
MNDKMPAVVNFGPAPFSVELREIAVAEIGENDVLLAAIQDSTVQQLLGQGCEGGVPFESQQDGLPLWRRKQCRNKLKARQ